MPTGVHHSIGLRRIVQPGNLVDRQRIHIRAQTDPAVAALLAVDQRHDTGLAKARVDLVHPVFAQLLRDDGAGTRFGKSDFGIRVQVAENLGQFLRALGDDGQNVHGNGLRVRGC